MGGPSPKNSLRQHHTQLYTRLILAGPWCPVGGAATRCNENKSTSPACPDRVPWSLVDICFWDVGDPDVSERERGQDAHLNS